MPAVIIEGMEMPTCCAECPFCRVVKAFKGDKFHCWKLKAYIGMEFGMTGRPDRCPLRPAPEWISVEERLPDHTRTVLGVNNAGCFFIACFSSGSWQYIPEEIHITHWMPLPEPPASNLDAEDGP